MHRDHQAGQKRGRGTRILTRPGTSRSYCEWRWPAQSACFVALTLLLSGAPLAEAQRASGWPTPRVKLGVDVLVEDGYKPLAGRQVGLITNPTGVAGDLQPTIDILHRAARVQLVALFGPEHGVRGDAPAGDRVEDGLDSPTGLPAYSLYGKTRKPTREMLRGVDVLVYDIQDIGARSYTYISTLAVAMEAAAENHVDFVVLDRPNPCGGLRVEGRPLDLKFQSFVGQVPVPYMHGMTVGELARMINEEGWNKDGVKCNLHVVPMRGWRRDMTWDQTGLAWIPTSPHIPRADTALFYSATGIIGELETLSIGVGYTLPFELVGRPDFEPHRLAAELNARGLAGVYFRPLHYQPYYAAFAKQNCGGVQVLLTDREQVELTAVQFHVLDAIRRLYPQVELFTGKRDGMFDKVCGTDEIRKLIVAGRPVGEVLAAWRDGVDAFKARRAKYLLYE